MIYSAVIILAMDYSLACQTLNYAGKLGLNDGRFAFIMFHLDFDPTGNKRKNLSGLFQKDWDVAAFQSALVLAVDNKVNAEYLTFMDNVKTLVLRVIRPCHTATILSRETKKVLFYHTKPHPHGFHCEA